MCLLLRQWRTDAKLTQRALAARLRKPYSFVYKVEAAERRIDPIEFVAWTKACGVSAAEAISEIAQ